MRPPHPLDSTRDRALELLPSLGLLCLRSDDRMHAHSRASRHWYVHDSVCCSSRSQAPNATCKVITRVSTRPAAVLCARAQSRCVLNLLCAASMRSGVAFSASVCPVWCCHGVHARSRCWELTQSLDRSDIMMFVRVCMHVVLLTMLWNCLPGARGYYANGCVSMGMAACLGRNGAQPTATYKYSNALVPSVQATERTQTAVHAHALDFTTACVVCIAATLVPCVPVTQAFPSYVDHNKEYDVRKAQPGGKFGYGGIQHYEKRSGDRVDCGMSHNVPKAGTKQVGQGIFIKLCSATACNLHANTQGATI